MNNRVSLQKNNSSSNNSTLNKVAQGGILLFGENLFIKSLDFLTGIVLLRFLGPKDYGIYTIGLSIVLLATMFTGKAEASLERYLPQWQAEHRSASMRRMFVTVIIINIILASFIVFIIWFTTGWLAKYFETPSVEPVVKLLLLLVISNNFINTATHALMGLFAYQLRVVLLLLRSITYLIYVVAIVWAGATLLIVIAGFMLISLFFALIMLGITSRELWRVTTDAALEDVPIPISQILAIIFHYSLPISGGFALHMLYARMGTLISGLVFGPGAAAYFGLAMMVYETVTQALISLFRALLATMAHLWGEGQQAQAAQLFRHSFRYATICGGIFSSLLILSARPLILLMGGNSYLPAAILLQILAIQLVIRLPYEVITVIYYLNKLTWRMLTFNSIKTGFDFLGYAILIPPLGLIGAATAHTFSYVAALFMYMFRLSALGSFGVLTMAKVIIRVLLLYLIIVIPLFYIQLYILDLNWFYYGIILFLVPFLWLTGSGVLGIVTPFDTGQLRQINLSIVLANRIKYVVLRTMTYYLAWIIRVTPIRFRTL